MADETPAVAGLRVLRCALSNGTYASTTRAGRLGADELYVAIPDTEHAAAS